MNMPHPYRYHEAFRGQLARLETMSPGVTTGAQRRPPRAFLELEHRGASTLELARYNRLLRHIELLIADWVTDGANLRFAEVDSNLCTDLYSMVEIADVPCFTTFVSLEPCDFLELETQPKSRIDGFYAREITSDGKTMAELTFVCSEPGWEAMDLCLYSDAMEIGSRIVVAELPIGEPFPLADIARLLRGNKALGRDPVIARAISAATGFMGSSLQKHSVCTPGLGP